MERKTKYPSPQSNQMAKKTVWGIFLEFSYSELHKPRIVSVFEILTNSHTYSPLLIHSTPFLGGLAQTSWKTVMNCIRNTSEVLTKAF